MTHAVHGNQAASLHIGQGMLTQYQLKVEREGGQLVITIYSPQGQVTLAFESAQIMWSFLAGMVRDSRPFVTGAELADKRFIDDEVFGAQR